MAVFILYVVVPTAIAIWTQRGPFTPSSGLFAVACALPFAFLASERHLRLNDRFVFPSAPWLALTCWVFTAAPSMIIVDPDARSLFEFDDDGIMWGRVLFVTWLWIVTLAAGPAARGTTRFDLDKFGYVALSLTSIAMLWISFQEGYLLPYFGLGAADAGSALSITALLAMLFVRTMLPTHALAFLAWPSWRFATVPLFLLTMFFVFASGSRSSQLVNAGLILILLRMVSMKPSLRLIVPIATVTVAGLVLVVTYRNEVASSRELSWRSPFAAVMVSPAVVRDENRENLSTRLWYGPQFFAAVSNYLDEGPAFSDTWKEGFLAILPTAIAPGKAEASSSNAIEHYLYDTGRYDAGLDLASTPWLHAVFDFGVVGILLFALAYGLALRWLDRSFTTPRMTWPKWFFLSCVFGSLAVADSKLDTVVFALRDPLWIAALLAASIWAFRWLKRIGAVHQLRDRSVAMRPG